MGCGDAQDNVWRTENLTALIAIAEEHRMRALIYLAILMLIARGLRQTVPPLRKLHLPTSVIAGLLGLSAAAMFAAIAPLEGGATLLRLDEVLQTWSAWPGTLIALVFAGMLMRSGRTIGRRSGLGGVLREALMVWIIVLGEAAVGGWMLWLWLGHQHDVPPEALGLIEAGFAGGHGTGTALGVVLGGPGIHYETGLDFALFIATIGLVYGVLSGVMFANLGIRAGWRASDRRKNLDRNSSPTVAPENGRRDDPSSESDIQTAESLGQRTIETSDRDPAERQSDIDRWAWQAIWILMAFAVGWAVQNGVLALGERLSVATDSNLPPRRTDLMSILGSFPLFIYTLGGGAAVSAMLRWFRVGQWIDEGMISRWTGIAMDVLVVAAIASLDLSAITGGWQVVLGLVIAGAVWTAFCLFFLARRILPKEHWFELALINYGMSTGTTATGFVLLRIVDPKVEYRCRRGSRS